MLFLDEPTSGVDPIGRRRFWEILVHLARVDGVAILLTTHYMREAEHCDRLALMHAVRAARRLRLSHEGQPHALLRRHRALCLHHGGTGPLHRHDRPNLAQAALLAILALMLMIFLSGAWTPPEAMLAGLRQAMYLSPLYHFIEMGFGILFKGAGLGVLRFRQQFG